MDSTLSPYRIAWQRPDSVNVRSASRAAVLDALDTRSPLSRGQLQAMTGLSPLTLRRACRQLVRENVVVLQYGKNSDTGHACDLFSPTRAPVLPVLEISPTRMVWRLCNPCGESVFATVQDRGAFRTAEDDLHLLMGRVATILRAGTCGLPAGMPLQAPVLLRGTSDTEAEKAVSRVLEAPPLWVLTPAEAAAREIRHLPEARGASCVLYLSLTASCTASLLVRSTAADPAAPLTPASYAAGMESTLRNTLRDIPRHTPEHRAGVRDFLQDVCRILTPDCLILEYDENPASESPFPPSAISPLPPLSATLRTFPVTLNEPPLSHRGAMRLSRRALWDSMESFPSQTQKSSK